MKFTKQPSILFIGLLMILGVSTNAPAEDEAKKLVIEYRDGTRQTLTLDKEWWHILNVLLPTTPAPLREDVTGPAGGQRAARAEDQGRHPGRQREMDQLAAGRKTDSHDASDSGRPARSGPPSPWTRTS